MANEITVYNDGSQITSAFKSTASLPQKQITHVAQAFQMGAYDMATEYVWKKTLVRLKEVILSLGEDLVYNLLQRPNDDSTPIDDLLTEYNIIKISEEIGLIDKKASMKLRHDSETIQFTFSSEQNDDEENDEGDELRQDEALSIIVDCAKYVLNVQNINVKIEFNQLRDKLLNDDLRDSDSIVTGIKVASLFYIRTILTVIITAIKQDEGANLEHAINNLNLLLPIVWSRLTRDDKYKIGFLYRDVAASGNGKAAIGVKNVLSKVHGFDYVPETLRSDTFIEMAQNLIDIHYNYNNFYNEARPTRELANLGSYIPDPAFSRCIKAYILVYIGNFYGESHDAAPIAKEQLLKIPSDKWVLFFNEILPYDEDLLYALRCDNPVGRFHRLLSSRNFPNIKDSLSSFGSKLHSAILKEDTSYIDHFLKK